MVTSWSATSRIDALLGRLPRWARLLLSLAAVALGVVLVTRPTTSLGVLAALLGSGLAVLGVLTVAGEVRSTRGGTARVATGVVMVAAGLFLLVFLGLTVRLAALVVGVALVVHGAGQALDAVRGSRPRDERAAAIMLGLAGVVLGVLALVWPDVTLLVTSVVLGVRLVVLGVVHGWSAMTGRSRRAGAPRAPRPARRWARTATAAAAVLLALAAGGVSLYLRGAAPVVDDFYAAPRLLPGEPGRLIRSEPFTRDVPPQARAWRILYTTSHGDGSPAVASALVVVPRDGAGSWPVVQWAHGTTGFARQCAPSLLEEPFASGAMFLLPEVLAQGWGLVATDYVGLGTEGPHPYLVGADSAYAVLDAARAARELDGADLGLRSVVWGHSQGGGAALWTGGVASYYAPDVPLDGVAALAPAANLPGLVATLPDVTGGSVFASFVLSGYAGVYPDVTWRDYVRPGAQTTVRAIASRCLSEPGVLVSVLELLALSRDPVITASDPGTGPLGTRLAENVPPLTTEAPLLLAQGADDTLITTEIQEEFVDAVCDAGQQLDYRTYERRDHVGLVQPDSPLVPDLIAWTHDRFADVPVEPGCLRFGERP